MNPPPSKRGKALAYVLALAFPCLVLGAAAFFNYQAARGAFLAASLESRGVVVSGQILAVEQSFTPKAGVTTFIRYRYRYPEDGGPSFSPSQAVTDALARDAHVGDLVPVVVLPDAPGVSDLRGNRAYVKDITIAAGIDLCLVAFALWLWRQVRRSKSEPDHPKSPSRRSP